MILLLTLAGRDAHADESGYHVPHYLLPWGNATVLSTILAEFLRAGGFTDVWLVANRRDDDYTPHVRAILRAHGIGEDRLVLTGDTAGQAATAMVGIAAIEAAGGASGAPLLLNSGDTILYGRDAGAIAATLRAVDAYVDVFSSSNRFHSYVLLDGGHRVSEIAEKIVVSDTATSGCYGFKDADTFRRHYVAGEDRYVSAVLKRLIAAGGQVVAGERHGEADTLVLHGVAQYLNAAAVRL